jgi:hypothetical protein
MLEVSADAAVAVLTSSWRYRYLTSGNLFCAAGWTSELTTGNARLGGKADSRYAGINDPTPVQVWPSPFTIQVASHLRL